MIEKLVKNDIGWFQDESGICYQTKSDYIFSHIIGFCGCGNSSEMFIYIRNYLTKLKNKDWGSYDDKGYMMFVYWSDEKGFTEHGTTIRCSWLTEKGEELLNDMNWCLENGGGIEHDN